MIRRSLIILVLLMIVFTGTWVLCKPGFYRAHDFVHAARVAEMYRALDAGHIPPRWSANFGYGYGMPLFNFYAPLPFIIGAVLYSVLPIVQVLKLLIVLATVGTAAGMYFFSREFFGRTASLIAALAATLAPYRAVNIYIRGALSEVWGMAWIPWLFLGVTRVARAQGGFFILAVSVAGMSLSHNLVTLMAVVLSGAWGVGLLLFEVWGTKHSLRLMFHRLWKLFLGYLAGFGVASWYILPSLLEKQYTQLNETILTGYFDFHLHFLYIRQLVTSSWGYGGSQWGPDDGLSFFLGYGQLLGVIFASVSLIQAGVQLLQTKRLVITRMQYLAVAAMGLLVVALGLTLTHALPVWEVLPVLSYLQFPWRWLSVSTVLLAFVAAWSVQAITRPLLRYTFAAVMGILLLLPVTNFRPESFLDTADSLYYTDAQRIQTHMSEVLPDFISNDLQVETLGVAEPIGNGTSDFIVHEEILNRPHEHLLRVTATKSQSVEFPIAYFPGWRVEVDGNPVLVEPSRNGRITATIPAGNLLVGVYFTESPVRRIANLISLCSITALIYGWLASRQRGRSI